MQDTPNTPVLLWCEAKDDAISGKGPERVIVEFFVVICLQACNWSAKMGANKGMKTNYSGQNIWLVAQSEGPNIVSMIYQVWRGNICSLSC
jgi:hypothetical protein